MTKGERLLSLLEDLAKTEHDGKEYAKQFNEAKRDLKEAIKKLLDEIRSGQGDLFSKE